ncbi:hypothetical protein [Mesoterricola sediminis]|uniref:Response regulatory domain-containing protein n=1 Tax=Mesoterricola sediminis TaxID=2927980 RepID=A0AA48H2T3_9BACT|nr:hypothetical protein [Mesoterricola sediminis]BDU78572.1 hypothetical protein METESE_35300 [Mesoterricola sediminis]
MGKRLLVVDSDRRFIQDHKAQLEAAFEVDFLFTTEGALTQLESGEYGAVLLCVETSDNKGYGLCLAIRRTPPPGDLKIALISAKASEEEYARHRQTKGRADLYLHKPIVSSLLIPALADLVPMREVDPDNPLGDLAGVDLGEEWLESLRSELELPAAPAPAPATPAAPQAIAPAPGWSAPVPPARNEGEVELLIWRVKDLEQKLAHHFDEAARKDEEIEALRQASAAVTRNLDEAQLGLQASETHRERAEGLEREAERLREDLQDALDEQKRLVEQLDESQEALAEKTLSLETLQAAQDVAQERLKDLEEAHGQLQARLEEAEAGAGQVQALEAALAEAREHGAAHEARAAGAEGRAGDLERRLEELEARLAEREAQAAETGAQAERLKTLEAELASAQDQVSFQDLTIHNLVEERNRLREERDRQDEALQGQGAETLLLQEKVALLEGASRDAAEELERLRELRGSLEAAVSRLEAQADASETAHEAQRMELMAGIDARDGQLGALGAEIEALKDRVAAVEREKAELADLVHGRDARLDTINAVLTELEAKARQAMDLAKSVSR